MTALLFSYLLSLIAASEKIGIEIHLFIHYMLNPMRLTGLTREGSEVYV